MSEPDEPARAVTRPAARRVELIGSPGAGKSTTFAWLREGDLGVDRTAVILDQLRSSATDRVVRTVAKALPRSLGERQSYNLFHRSRDFPRSSFQFAAAHPDLVACVATMATTDTHPCVRAWRVLQKNAEMQAVHQFCFGPKATPKDAGRVVLLDEEFVQLLVLDLVATDLGPGAVDLANRYLDLAPLPDVLVAIRTPADLCIERLGARDHGWPFIVVSKHGPEFVRRVATSIDLVLPLLTDRGVRVVTVDGAAERPDPPALVAEVSAALR